MKSIKEISKVLPSKNSTVIPALNSNNLAFDIFCFFSQPKAQILLRSLSRKGLEKSKFLHLYSPDHAIFTQKYFEFNPIYDFHIGLLLTKSEFIIFGETEKFNKFLFFKGYHEGLIHYF